MKKIVGILLITVSAFTLAFAAQETPAQTQTVEWQRLQSDNGEFSIEMPAKYAYFFDKDGFNYDGSGGKSYQFAHMQLLGGASEKTVMSVEIYKVSSPKSYLSELIDRQRLNGTKKDESLPGFTIKKFEQREMRDSINAKSVEINFIIKFIASKTHLYVVSVANRGAKTPASERFLSSMSLNSTPTAQTDNPQIVKISTLKPVTLEQIGENATGSKKPDNSRPPPAPPASAPPSIADSAPVLIMTKPFAGYSEAARRNGESGIVRLRTTFAGDGQIPKIAIVESLSNGLNRSAVFAALRIKFIPQEKNGVPQTITKVIEYSFRIY